MRSRFSQRTLLRVSLVVVCLLGWAGAQAGVASQLALSGVPPIAYTGASVGTVTVTVQDSLGGTVTSSSAAVQLQVTGPNGFNYNLGGLASSGVATLNTATGALANGTYTLTASSPGLASATQQLTIIAGSAVLPATAVGSSSAVQNITFGFGTTTTVAGVQVLFKGTSGLDFTESGSGTCIGTQTAGATCTVPVVFSPKAPGTRLGAVELTASGGAILQTIYISGLGLGAQVNFSASSQTSLGTGLGYPDALIFDGQGNLYIANYPADSSTGDVLKIPKVGGVLDTASQSVVSSGLNYADGLAIDGSGNLFVADYDENKIIEVPANGGANITVLEGASSVGSALWNPAGLAVDGAGDLFICDYGNNRVIEIPNQNGQLNSAAAIYLGQGLSAPSGIKVDSAGNLIVADFGNARVVEIPNQGGVFDSAAQKTLVSDTAGEPSDVALDAAGNLYIALEVGQSIEVVPYQNGTYDASASYLVAAGLNYPDSVIVDSAGNVFFCDTYNGFVYEVDTVDPPALNFGSTGVGHLSATKTVPVINGGNQTLSLNSITFDSLFPNQGSTCASSLASGASCNLVTAFAPTALGAASGTSVLTDDAVNQPSTTQTLNLSGTGVQGAQAISFSTAPAQTYGGAPVTLSATGGGSGNPVTFSLVSGPATLSGSTLSFTGAGTVVVAANQAGNTLYLAAPEVQQSITVNPAVLTVTASDASMSYGATPPSFTYTITGYVNGDTIAAVSGAPSLTTTATSTSPAGTYAITAGFGTLNASNYNFTFVAGTLTVTRATPTGSWNPATPPAYGNGLGSGVLNASSSTPGAWAYSDGGVAIDNNTVLPAGTTTLTAVLTPYDATDYAPLTLTHVVTVPKAQLTVTPTDEQASYGNIPALTAYTITGFVNHDTASVISGTPTLSTTATNASVVGTYPITADVSAMSAANYTFTAATGTLTVVAATPATTWTPAAPTTFTFGTTLNGLLNASSPVAGTWIYTMNGAAMTNASVLASGTWTLAASLHPADSINYKAVTIDLTVHVNKATVTVTANNVRHAWGLSLPPLTYTTAGWQNGDAPGVASGAPVLTTTATSTSPGGDYPINVSVSGMSAQNYVFVGVNGTFTMEKAVLTVTASNVTAPYGAVPALTQYTITGFQNGDTAAVVSGTPVLSTTATNTSPIGTYPINVDVSGLSAADYTFVAAPGTLTLSTATPAASWTPAAPTTFTFGTSLRGLLNATSPVPGTWTYTMNGAAMTDASVVASGTWTLVAAFQPTDTTDYTGIHLTLSITVNKATITVTANPVRVAWGAAIPVLGYTMTGWQNGDAPGVAQGTPVLTTTATSSAAPGTYPIAIDVSALSAQNYVFAGVGSTLTVNKAVLTVTASDVHATYGAIPALTAYTFSGFRNGDTASAVSGTPVLTTTATNTSPVGTYPINIDVSGLSSSDYTFTSVPGTLTVGIAAPVISWTPAAPTTFTFGTTLNGLLDASSNVPGVWSYTMNGAPMTNASVLATGVYTLVGAFTPADAVDYSSARATLTVTVQKATLTVTAASFNIPWHTAVPALTYTIIGFQNGDYPFVVQGTPVLSTAGTAASDAGTYPITVSIAGLSAQNYVFSAVNGVLTITPQTTSVQWTSTGSLPYGTPLAPLLTATSSTGGAITYTANGTPVSATTVLGAGSFTLTAAYAGDVNHTPSSASMALTIVPAPLAVVVNSFSRQYGQENPVFTGSVSGAVNDDLITATFTSAAIASSPVGTYPIVATLSPASVLANYTVTNTPGTLTITPAVTTVTWLPASGTITYGTSLAGVLNATSSTGEALTYTANGQPVTAATVLNAGGYTLTATLAADSNHLAASATYSLLVTPASLTVTVASFSRIYGVANPVLTGTVSGAVNGDVITASYATTADSSSSVGAYPITATLAPASVLANYAVSNPGGTLTITPAPTATTWTPSSASIVYGTDLTGLLNATSPDGTQFTYSDSGMPVTTASILPAGNHTLTATLVVDGNHSPSSATFALTVTKAPTSVVWTPNTGAISYGTPLGVILNATTSSGETITYTLSGNAVGGSTVLDGGSYTLIASVPGDANHTGSSASFSLTVTPAPSSVTWLPGSASIVYGTPLGSLLDATSSNGGVITYTGPSGPVGPGTVLPVGTYVLTASYAGDSNYMPASANFQVTVTRATTTVTWTPAGGSLVYGAPLASVLTAVPSQPGSLSYTANGNPVTATTVLPAGTYTLTATLTASQNYSSSSANYALTVQPAPLQFVVANASRAYGVANPSFSGTFTGLVNGDTLTANYATTATSTSPVGTYPVTATLGPANVVQNYTPSITPGTLTVTQAEQVITFPSISDQVYSGSPVTVSLQATASSGLPVSYTVSGPATLAGTSLKITGVGAVTVTASQAGNSNYGAAAPVSQKFIVRPGFAYALFATSATCSSIDLSGNISVDSYDSSQGAYPAGRNGSGGNLGTNGNLDLSGSVTVAGALYDPNGNTTGSCSGSRLTSLTQNGDTTVSGGIVTLAEPQTYAAPAAPSPAPPTSAQTPSWGNCNGIAGCAVITPQHFALAPGSYGDLQLQGGLTFDLGAGTYNINQLTVTGGATLNVTSGPVVLNLAGAGVRGAVLQFTAGGNIVNASAPLQLQIRYAGTGTIELAGTLNLVVNAPNAQVELGGNLTLSGAVIASTISGDGGISVHFDRSLGQASSGSGDSASSAGTSADGVTAENDGAGDDAGRGRDR